MDKVRMRRKPGNVYHTPVNPPASTHTPQRIDPRTGEVRGKIMAPESHENAQQWYDIFREMAAECPDHHRRKRQRIQQQK